MAKSGVKIQFNGGLHICYLYKPLYDTFCEEYLETTYNKWLSQEIYQNFGLHIDSKENLIKFKQELLLNYYSNPGEWVSERMRYYLKFHKKTKKKVFCYRNDEFGEILYLIKDIYNVENSRATLPAWSNRKSNKLLLFDSIASATEFINGYYSDKLKIKMDYINP